MEDKLFLGFGILVVICGVWMIVDKNYLIGISGAVVGATLVFSNFQKIRNKN